MKIINVYINCFIIEGAAKDASFFVNNIAFEYIQVSSQDNEIGFIPVPYNFIEDCINNEKIIEIICVVNAVYGRRRNTSGSING